MWWTTATVRSNQRKTKQSYLTVFGLLQYVLQLHGHLDAALVLVSTFGSLTSTQTYQTMWWTQYRRTPLCQSTLSKRGKQTCQFPTMEQGQHDSGKSFVCSVSISHTGLPQSSENPVSKLIPTLPSTSWLVHMPHSCLLRCDMNSKVYWNMIFYRQSVNFRCFSQVIQQAC